MQARSTILYHFETRQTLNILSSEEDLKKKLEQLQTDKAKNEKEYAEWQASCEAWKKSHANHPNKELFNKYNEEVLIFTDSKSIDCSFLGVKRAFWGETGFGGKTGGFGM